MRNGYTLVELLIVIAISAMLAAMVITYSGVGRNEVSVSVEAAKIESYILKAKNLAIATYDSDPNTCGYGVDFSIASDTYSLFAYQPGLTTAGCPSVASVMTAGITAAAISSSSISSNDWNVAPPNGVQLMDGGNGDNLVVVLFIPPAPAALISRDGSTFLAATSTPSYVYLRSTDGATNANVSINSAGQVSL
jgi:prepilin-type N-terminal cleavage/methylation domain-containing protein